jgi:hypothetical protein
MGSLMAIIAKIQLLILTLVLTVSSQAQAHTEEELGAVTTDGRQVLLKADHTWSFAEFQEGDPANSAVLTIINVHEMQDACRLELRMKNNLGFKIRSLVPRFGVYNQEGVMYESKSKSFSAINPTKTQYTTIQFSGIGCHAISHIKVFDAGRCRMGNIDQWNEEEGQCLSHIYMEPTDLISISK